MKKKKVALYKGKHFRNEEEEVEEMPVSWHDVSGESPNRVVLPRKIGKRHPEEERGYKPLVI